MRPASVAKRWRAIFVTSFGSQTVAKLIDVDELEEFQPVLTSQMRPVELNGKQLLPLRHVLGLLRAEASGGNARAVGLIQRLQASA